MRSRLLRCGFLAMVATGVALASPSSAKALLTVTFSQAGFASVTITDQSAVGGGGLSGDLNPTLGHIATLGTYGSYTITIDTASSNAPDAIQPATLTSNITAFANTLNANPLIVTAVETAYIVPPPGSALMNTEFSLTNPNAATTFTSTLQGTADGDPSTLHVLTNGGFLQEDKTTIINVNPFTMQIVTTLLITSGTGTTNNVQPNGTLTVSNVVPAPPSVILALAGLPMIGLFGWLRARRKSVESLGAVA
jgi:hypothetical protein